MQFSGIVQKGARRGTELGYPTVNIPLPDASIAGVYVARVRIGDEEYDAVAFADQRRKVLEAHLLDFSADLYGWNITITLLKKLRESKRFTTDAALQKTIARDLTSARAYFMKKE